MPFCVCSGAKIRCSFGTGISALNVTTQMTISDTATCATVMDSTPANLGNFIMCTTQSNPAVASATAAAMGTPTPSACTPNTVGKKWTPGNQKVKFGSFNAAQSTDTLTCAYGGVITILPIPPMPKTSL